MPAAVAAAMTEVQMTPADGVMAAVAAVPMDVRVAVVTTARIAVSLSMTVPVSVAVILTVMAIADGVIGDVVQDAVDRVRGWDEEHRPDDC